jgi:hypothetical protein
VFLLLLLGSSADKLSCRALYSFFCVATKELIALSVMNERIGRACKKGRAAIYQLWKSEEMGGKR